MSHIIDHCPTPRVKFLRREGSVWACTCGRIWVMGYHQWGKDWTPWVPLKKEEGK